MCTGESSIGRLIPSAFTVSQRLPMLKMKQTWPNTSETTSAPIGPLPGGVCRLRLGKTDRQPCRQGMNLTELTENLIERSAPLLLERIPMSVFREPFFPHRRNRDGSYDSICLTCFETIGSAGTQEELVKIDKEHVCEPSRVAERGLLHALSGAGATSS
jgi:hypothetical protein